MTYSKKKIGVDTSNRMSHLILIKYRAYLSFHIGIMWTLLFTFVFASIVNYLICESYATKSYAIETNVTGVVEV